MSANHQAHDADTDTEKKDLHCFLRGGGNGERTIEKEDQQRWRDDTRICFDLAYDCRRHLATDTNNRIYRQFS